MSVFYQREAEAVRGQAVGCIAWLGVTGSSSLRVTVLPIHYALICGSTIEYQGPGMFSIVELKRTDRGNWDCIRRPRSHRRQGRSWACALREDQIPAA